MTDSVWIRTEAVTVEEWATWPRWDRWSRWRTGRGSGIWPRPTAPLARPQPPTKRALAPACPGAPGGRPA